MEAKERSFTFMGSASYYDIPFFQRAYVWDEDNWTELLNNFFEYTESHFLGSIILKQEQTKSGEASRFMIIDGQQRLTTLSILLRACYDRLMEDTSLYDDAVVADFEKDMRSLLFIKPDKFTAKEDVKICHSKLDKPYYQAVINGELSDYQFKEKDPRAKGKKVSRIERCYMFFRDELHSRGNEDIQSLWNLLTTDTSKFLVNIDLGVNENEQKIFDTVNSYGVRLSSSDTIKNFLFQYYIDALRHSNEPEVDVIASSLYDETWGKAFAADDDTSAYWAATKRYGRLTRDNIEVLLHSFAVIMGFFDPSVDNIVSLSQKYKDKTKDMSRGELEEFLHQLKKYADAYRSNFNSFNSDTALSFGDYKNRLLHLCFALDVATFYPYILKLLYLEKEEKGDATEIKELLQQLEKYIVLNAICGGPTKNYNNECVQLIRDRKKPNELITSSDYIGRKAFNEGLRRMRNNKIPTAILFWVELYDRHTKYSDIKELKYIYTLEHIMPQKWQLNWPVSALPVFSENGYEITDERDAEEERAGAVYEIGNMTLLNSKLNTSLSNNTFTKKVNGDGNKDKHCMRDLADLYLTREVIEKELWDERSIRKRTADLQKKIETIWNIEFEEDQPIHIEFDSSKPETSFDDAFDEETTYEDILFDLERSDLGEDERSVYKKIIFDEILDSYEGGYSWEGDGRIFDKDNREVIEAIGDSTYPNLAAALLAVDDGDKEKCIESFKSMFDEGEHETNGKISEIDFLKLVVLPVCNAIPDFYIDFYNRVKLIEMDEIIPELCKALDAFYDEEDLENKVDVLNPLIEKYPDNINLNLLLGELYFEEKEWAKAIEHLEKCVDQNDIAWYSEAHLLDNLSFALQKDSEEYSLENSIKYCEKLIDIDPDGNVYARIGHAFHLQGEYSKAIDSFKKSLDYEPTNTAAANDLAKSLAFSGRHKELKEYIDNPPISLRKYTLEIAEKELSKAENKEEYI